MKKILMYRHYAIFPGIELTSTAYLVVSTTMGPQDSWPIHMMKERVTDELPEPDAAQALDLLRSVGYMEASYRAPERRELLASLRKTVREYMEGE